MNHKGILEEFSGLQTKQLIGDIVKYHRISASPGINEAARYVHSVAQQVGLNEVELKKYEVDGNSKWWTWKKPWYWTARSAELRVETPQKMVLARFADIPCSLAVYSGPTPGEGITAEIVDVGRGLKDEDYEGKDVKGKIVLLSGTQWGASYATKLAQEKGAIGVIFDNIIESPPTRTRVDVPDIVGYNRVRVNKNGSAVIGFSINHKQMLMLKDLLTKGPVTVHAQVDTELGVGKLPVVTGVIKGSTNPDEEVVLIAHLCHPAPSANDNASGSALLLELARALNVLIAKGKLNVPKRTLRFIWVPEFYGTIAYLHENEYWPSNIKAVLCCDMVGENQIKCGGPLVVETTPDSLPSFLNDLVEHFLETIPKEEKMYSGASVAGLWKYSVAPFGGGSDHVPFVDRSCGVPSIMFGHWPDRFYHSSEDTLDKVDHYELERVAWVVSEVMLALANANQLDVDLFTEETFGRCLHRLRQKTQEILWKMKETITHWKSIDNEQQTRSNRIGEYARRGVKTLQFRQQIEQTALESVLRLVAESDQPEGWEKIKSLQEELEQKTQQFIQKLLKVSEKLGGAEARKLALKQEPITEETQELQRIIPQRKWKGPLNLYVIEDLLGPERARWFEERVIDDLTLKRVLSLAAMWIDGTRDLWDIIQRIQLSTSIEIDLKTLRRYFEDLQEAGLVELKKKELNKIS
ncbi:MAG: DUF4910 domain-containing protein [Candidatus Hodarchaeota archaeon]